MKVIGIDDSIFLHEKDGLYLRVRFSDILCVTALSNYARVYVSGRDPFLVSVTLQEMLTQIPSSYLLRISRSVAVNTTRIEAVRGNEVLVAGRWFMLSRIKRRELLQR